MRRNESNVKSLFRRPSPYQQVFVGETGGVRFLRFGDSGAGWQGAMKVSRPELLYFPYQQAFSFYTAWNPTIRRFLSLGVGTGTAISHVHRRHPQAEIVGVEWDPMVLQVAEEYFQLPSDSRVSLYEADARTYIMKIQDRFDLIYVDVYFQEETPKVLYSPLYLHTLSELLEPGGVLAINAILATKGPLSYPFVHLCTDLETLIGPTYSITLGAIPQITHNVMIFAQRLPTTLRTMSEIRKRSWQEIHAHQENYMWSTRLMPFFIKKSGKKV